ncbi:hypothetical protein J2X97_001861 [Epilithonimonas hungarica]|uniref:hypothetical protein n=1 Tax=Epilithonimonas hungarica TaxID=454006 RepID=UPI002780F241|nr:hypothetical protein [Epilithonimonas hungarica]MDP9956224.1 hypothetical protein [Epilithonimonas hungarica]
MDQQIQLPESPSTIADLIPALENELLAISIQVEKATEIGKYLKSGNMDMHTVQTIMDILGSIPDTKDNKNIIRLRNKFNF